MGSPRCARQVPSRPSTSLSPESFCQHAVTAVEVGLSSCALQRYRRPEAPGHQFNTSSAPSARIEAASPIGPPMRCAPLT